MIFKVIIVFSRGAGSNRKVIWILLTLKNLYVLFVSVDRVECYAPSTIQAAVYSGHKVARGLDEMPTASEDLIRELPSVGVKT